MPKYNIEKLKQKMEQEISAYGQFCVLANMYTKSYNDTGDDFFARQAKEMQDIAELIKSSIVSMYTLALM